MLGAIALAERRPQEAITEFRAQDQASLVGAAANLGRAYDLAGIPDSAIASYQRYLDTPFIGRLPLDAVWRARALYRLGELYEEKGDRVKAADRYAEFVKLWKRADADLQPKVTEAKQRLEALSGERADDLSGPAGRAGPAGCAARYCRRSHRTEHSVTDALGASDDRPPGPVRHRARDRERRDGGSCSGPEISATGGWWPSRSSGRSWAPVARHGAVPPRDPHRCQSDPPPHSAGATTAAKLPTSSTTSCRTLRASRCGAACSGKARLPLRRGAPALRARPPMRSRTPIHAGVVHRDIKPGNILLVGRTRRRGRLRHRATGPTGIGMDEDTLTSPGLVIGTPGVYEPGTGARATHEVDRRSDVYSLGVVLYEMLTGQPPFVGRHRACRARPALAGITRRGSRAGGAVPVGGRAGSRIRGCWRNCLPTAIPPRLQFVAALPADGEHRADRSPARPRLRRSAGPLYRRGARGGGLGARGRAREARGASNWTNRCTSCCPSGTGATRRRPC